MNIKRIALTLLVAISLLGCETEISKENLQGKWQIESYEATDPKFPYLIDAVKQTFLSNIYVLNADNSYQVIKDKATIEQGNWNLAANKQLEFTDASGNKKIFSIESLSKNKLKLRDSEKYAMTDILIELNKE